MLAINRDVDLFSRKRSQMEQTTHQIEAATNQIKAKKIFATLRSLLWLEIGDNLLLMFSQLDRRIFNNIKNHAKTRPLLIM